MADLAWLIASRGLAVMTREEHARLVEGGETLARDEAGDETLRTQDGRVVKHFRLKRVFSSAVLRPHALRFRDNAAHLRALGFASVDVLDVRRLREPPRHVLVYAWLPGTPLRDALRERDDALTPLARFATFLARLHERGVVFRSFHFGNCLVQPDGGFALLDVVDVRFHGRSLGIADRVRNFRHLWRYEEDVRALEAHGLDRFIGEYVTATRLPHAQRHRLGAELAGKLRSIRPKSASSPRT